jgi:hypothetical protein
LSSPDVDRFACTRRQSSWLVTEAIPSSTSQLGQKNLELELGPLLKGWLRRKGLGVDPARRLRCSRAPERRAEEARRI